MASPEIWLEVLSWVKAIFDAVKLGEDVLESYEKHRRERDTIQEAQRVSVQFSTYSEAEVRAILVRLKGCQERFIQQGGGADRSRCLCSVFNEVREGNGGQLPRIDDWENIYRQLQCGIKNEQKR